MIYKLNSLKDLQGKIQEMTRVWKTTRQEQDAKPVQLRTDSWDLSPEAWGKRTQELFLSPEKGRRRSCKKIGS